jgi:hypothetical protein
MSNDPGIGYVLYAIVNDGPVENIGGGIIRMSFNTVINGIETFGPSYTWNTICDKLLSP